MITPIKETRNIEIKKRIKICMGEKIPFSFKFSMTLIIFC